MRLLLVSIIWLGVTLPCLAQMTQQNRVFIYESVGLRNRQCYLKNKVADSEDVKTLRSDPGCGLLGIPDSIDFEKNSLIVYEMLGDCRMSGAASISLDRQARLYTIHLNNYWGGCRAGGRYSGWLLIDRIPEEFSVKFEVKLLETGFPQRIAEELPVTSSEVSLNGCIRLDLREQKVLSSKKEYLAAIRQDVQSASCADNADNLEFTKFTYIGVSLNSGYCGRAAGLSSIVRKYGGSRLYVLDISYRDPQGRTCRALSKYDLWIRVPGTETEFSALARIHPR